MMRRIAASLLAVALTLGLAGCASGDATTRAMEAIPGVTKATGTKGSGRGVARYTLDVALADEPSGDTFVAVYQTFIDAMATFDTDDVTMHITWVADGFQRRMGVRNDEMPPEEYVRGIADWPAWPVIHGSYYAKFSVSLVSDDDAQFAEAVRLVTAIPAEVRGATTPRYDVRWDDDEPCMQLFDAFAPLVPSATELRLAESDVVNLGGFTVSWAAQSDAVMAEMSAAVDVWAALPDPLTLYLVIDGKRVALLTNDRCPDNDLPLTAELWRYATSDGRTIALAPSGC